MTPYQKHKRKWSNCERCDLCQKRKHVVLARGRVPADILLIGEAPGASEDVLAKPFCGPAGKLMDHIINRALDGQSYCLTNLVACIPRGDGGKKIAEPPEYAIEECAPRLQEMIDLCSPYLIVCVGKLAVKWVTKLSAPSSSAHVAHSYVEIIHPAAILRMDVSQKSLAIQRTIVTLADAVDELPPF